MIFLAFTCCYIMASTHPTWSFNVSKFYNSWHVNGSNMWLAPIYKISHHVLSVPYVLQNLINISLDLWKIASKHFFAYALTFARSLETCLTPQALSSDFNISLETWRPGEQVHVCMKNNVWFIYHTISDHLQNSMSVSNYPNSLYLLKST